MASRALQRFSPAFERVLGQLHIGRALNGSALAGVDMSESFRASVVLGVSALDSYVHDLCVDGIVDSFHGTRPRNSNFGEIRISLTAAESWVQSGSHFWLESEIRQIFARSTLQRPDDIAKALRFIDDSPRKWVRIAACLGSNSQGVMARLNSIVDRRNMIVHEADVDPAWSLPRPITADETEGATSFLNDLVHAIDRECW